MGAWDQGGSNLPPLVRFEEITTMFPRVVPNDRVTFNLHLGEVYAIRSGSSRGGPTQKEWTCHRGQVTVASGPGGPRLAPLGRGAQAARPAARGGQRSSDQG